MSYSYTTGQGLAAMTVTEPAGTEPYLVVAAAVRQIKAYLNDTSVGPEAKLVTLAAAIAALSASLSATGVAPVGTIAFRGASGDIESSGWLLCDGRAVSRTTYQTLFNEIGVTFGAGNNLDTFNLPKANGRALVGADQGRNLLREVPTDVSSPFAVMGKHIGEQRVALTEQQLPVHDHAIASPGTGYFVAADGAFNIYSVAGDSHGNAAEIPESNATGGTDSHQNNQPSLALPCYIKYR